MKALVIAPQPFFSPRGTPFSVYYRTMVTAEKGVQVDLLTYGQGADVDLSNVRIFRIPDFRILGKVKVGPSHLKLFLDIFMILWAIGLLIKNRYTFVHAHEEAVFFCRFLKPLFGFKLVYDMHSSLPQQLSNFKFTKSKLLINLFELLENDCLSASDAIITICPDLAKYVRKLRISEHKHFLIENSIFEPVQLKKSNGDGEENINKNSGQPKVSFDDHQITQYIVYAGTLEPYQGIDILLAAFARLRPQCHNAGLVVVGGRADQVRLYQQQAKELGIEAVVCFTGQVPQTIAKEIVSKSHVQVSPRTSGTNTPLKVYEQLANGIPLVATNIYSHTQVLDRSVAVMVAPNPKDMAKGLLTALQSETVRHTVTKQARALYDEKYARPVYEKKINNLLRLLN